jgi:uncharacterized protein YuzE
MKKAIKYTNEPIKAKVIKDILPPPGTLRHGRAPLRVCYNTRSDKLILTVRLGAAAESEEVSPGVLVARDASGNILAVEVLTASKLGVNPKAVEFAVS